MKKHSYVLAAVCCLGLLAAGVTGCGGSSTSTGSVAAPATEADDASGETADGASGDVSDGASAETTEAQTTEAASDDVTIEETVLLDANGIKITATEYTVDSIWGDGIKVLVENNSDVDATVSCNALIVNDYMISDFFSTEVAAGKKSNETIDLYSSELEAAGIDTIGKIDIYFHIYNSDTWDTILDSDCVTLQTSAFDTMDTTANDDSGYELYNENGIRIVGQAVDENSFWGTAIVLYCENNSGRNIGIDVEDMSINGFMMTPYFYTYIYNGKRSVDAITILSSDLEDNGIESIETAELQFHIYDVDTYETIVDTAPITFSVQ